MRVVVVRIRMRPEFRREFLASLRDLRSATLAEPGCLRFDVVQDEADENQVWLYEAYRGQAALDEHLRAPHFVAWRDAVVEWHAAPSEVVLGWSLFPPD